MQRNSSAARIARVVHQITLLSLLWGGGMALGGCSPLEPIMEPEASDLQMTVDTLQSTVREAQKTIVELRADLDSRRQELADAQIARARLEGRVREAERRLAEARQVIDMQREELASSRSERERVARTGIALQSQLKQLQKQLTKMNKQANDVRPASTHSTNPSPAEPSSVETSKQLEDAAGIPDQMAEVSRAAPAQHIPVQATRPMRVSVKPGDTLWSIAQRYRVSVKRLMAINQLPDNQIQVGQALWLSEPTVANDAGREKVE